MSLKGGTVMKHLLQAIATAVVLGASATNIAYGWDYPPFPNDVKFITNSKTKMYIGSRGGPVVQRGAVENAVKSAPLPDSEAATFLKENAKLVDNLTFNQECPLSLKPPGLYCGLFWRNFSSPPTHFQDKMVYGALQMLTDNVRRSVSLNGNPGNITDSEVAGHFRGDLQSQINVWMKLQIYDGGLRAGGIKPSPHAQGNDGLGILTKFKRGHTVWPTPQGGAIPLDAATVIACAQIGPGMCRSGKTDSWGQSVSKFAANIRKNTPLEKAEMPVADGFTGCLKGATLPAPEFVGPPAPGTQTTPDFKQEPPLVMNSSMTGSSFDSACKQQIELDLKGMGVTKLARMPYNDNEHIVISRFGQVRTHKSGGYRYHAGVDLATPSSKRVQIVAADNGTIRSANGKSENALYIQRANSDHVYGYLHMRPSSTSHLKVGQEVKAGDVVGLESNYHCGKEWTNEEIKKPASERDPCATVVHLHLEYYVPPETRGNYTPAVAVNDYNIKGKTRFPDFRDLKVMSPFKKVVATDPAPFLPQNIPMSKYIRGMKIKDGKELLGNSADIFGASAQSQYCITRSIGGSAGEGLGRYSSAQEFIEYGGPCGNKDNTDGSNTGEWSQWLPDSDGWGEIDKWLDMSPNGEYDYRSFLERALDVARERFNSTAWNQKIMHLSSLKLWQDYLLARRTEMWLDWQMNQKRARINSMLAVLLAQRSEPAAAQTRLLSEKATLAAGQ